MTETMAATWESSTWRACPKCGQGTVTTQGYLGRVDALFERGRQLDTFVYHSPTRYKDRANRRR